MYVCWKDLRSLLREFDEYAVWINIVEDVKSGRQGFGGSPALFSWRFHVPLSAPPLPCFPVFEPFQSMRAVVSIRIFVY